MAKHNKHPPRTGPDWLKQPPPGSGKLKIGRPVSQQICGLSLRHSAAVSAPTVHLSLHPLCTWQIIIIDEICN